jgi:hypothetical protein
MKPKDILSIYLSDNALANQKTTYYFAVNALLVVPVTNIHTDDPNTAALLCGLGVIFSAISLLSITRTAAFREKWKKLLQSTDDEYINLFSDTDLPWWGRFRSRWILMAPPVIGIFVWVWAVFVLWLW